MVLPCFEDIAGVLAKVVARCRHTLACGASVERLRWQLACSNVAMYVGALALGVVDQADRLPPLDRQCLKHDGEFEIVRSTLVADEDPALGQPDLECALFAQTMQYASRRGRNSAAEAYRRNEPGERPKSPIDSTPEDA